MSNEIVPYSVEAEESLLGNILLYKEAIRLTEESGLSVDDFYLKKHQSIFNIMLSMYENRESIDTVSITSKLKDFGIYDEVGGLDYIMHLVNTTISATNTKEYINIIKNKSLARKVIRVGEEISKDALDSKVSVDEMLSNVEEKVTSVTRSKTDYDFHNGATLFDETLKEVQNLQDRGEKYTGVRTLYTALDNLTAGFQKGDLIIVAARPSMGKTALALNFAVNSASVTPGSVAIFSLEMPVNHIAMRILAIKSGVDIQKIRTGNLNNADWSKLNEASQELKRQNFYIDDTSGIRVPDIYAKCRKLSRDNNLNLVIIDYIQLIESSEKTESRQQQVSDISRKLKALARELNVPVIALSQLSRRAENRGDDKRPMLSDLRESGAIEQDADLVMFLFRPDYYKHDEESKFDREDVELNLAKHRNGPTDTIKLAFEKKVNTFYGIKNNVEENS